MKNKEK